MVARNRGQLILVGAILIALTIVASAVLLNSVYSNADVQSQQDRQSLEQTEQTTQQIRADLQRLFLINGTEKFSGTPVPFVTDDDKFYSFVEEYDEQYRNISSLEQSGFVNTTLVDATEETNSQILWQNDSRDFGNLNPGGGSSAVFVNNPDSLTYFNLVVTEIASPTNNLEIDFQLNGGGPSTSDVEIRVTPGGELEIDGDVICDPDSISEEEPLVLELSYGVGEARSDGSVCETIDISDRLESASNYNLRFQDNDEYIGEFDIVTTDGTIPDGPEGEDRGYNDGVTIYVEPVFEVSYQSPQVYYSGNVTVYGGTP